jgi:hypothetical protein
VNQNWPCGWQEGLSRGAKNVQKKLRKLLTGTAPSAIVAAHTVNTNYIKKEKMRTKVLLCAVAMAASIASSLAQVYSLNVVGYYNVTVKGNNGLNLIANQLNNGTNGLNQVIPTADAGDQVLTFTGSDYNVDIFDGTVWLDNNSGNSTTTTVSPGQGFFFMPVGANKTMTFVGEVPQGPVNLALPTALTLVSTKTPQQLELTAANGFPIVAAASNGQVLYFDNVAGAYVVYVTDGTTWYDNNSGDTVTLAPKVGQAWFWQGTTTAWNRTFTVQ